MSIQQIDRQELDIQQSPDQLVVLRDTDAGWNILETRYIEMTADSVVIEADTPRFSYFAVAVDNGSIPADSISQTVIPGSTPDESGSGGLPVVFITVIFVLVIVIAVVALQW